MLLLVAHQVHHREPRDGMVLGAVVGAGFAAFESAGYALQALLDNLDDQTVVAILEIEAFRAVLAPFGHITWTALIGGALFASSRGGRFHLTRGLVLTILGVVTLHALWDQSYGWAVMLTRGLVMDAGWELLWPNAQFWAVPPTGSDLVWFNTIYDVLLGDLVRRSARPGSSSPGAATAAPRRRPPPPRRPRDAEDDAPPPDDPPTTARQGTTASRPPNSSSSRRASSAASSPRRRGCATSG